MSERKESERKESGREDDGASETVALSVPGGGRARADEWALVLASQGVRARVAPGERGYSIYLAAGEREYAQSVLEDYQRENRPSGKRAAAARDVAEPLGKPGLSGLIAALALLGVHLVLGAHDIEGRSHLYAAASADAARIAAGDWWRAVTALCLHADFPHMLGNAFLGAYFVTAVSRSLGGGLAIALVTASGAIGNLANASLQGPAHDSVGASTAVFGAIGLLSGLALARRRRSGLRGRRMLVPAAAGLALLAMLGMSGARVDIGAHLAGLVTGGALGLGAAPLALRRPPLLGQLAIGLATASFVAWCWVLALEHEPRNPGDTPSEIQMTETNTSRGELMPKSENAVEVPYQQLSPETLRSVAEEFVTRDGTDYGATEKTLDQKVARLLGQLESGDAKIYFDAESETIHIVAKVELNRSG